MCSRAFFFFFFVFFFHFRSVSPGWPLEFLIFSRPLHGFPLTKFVPFFLTLPLTLCLFIHASVDRALTAVNSSSCEWRI